MITFDDIVNPNKTERNKVLFGGGFDPNGNNEIGAWYRRLAQVSGENAAQGLTFRNSLEPQRQGAISAGVALANPSNMVENARANGASLINQGSEAGVNTANQLASMGYGAGAQAGAVAQGANQGTHAANQLLQKAYSPEEQMKALQTVLQFISQAPGQGLQELMQMFSGIETRSNQNKADKAAGSGLGQLGGLIGMLSQYAPMLMGAGGAGGLGGLIGGSNGASSGWQQAVY